MWRGLDERGGISEYPGRAVRPLASIVGMDRVVRETPIGPTDGAPCSTTKTYESAPLK